MNVNHSSWKPGTVTLNMGQTEWLDDTQRFQVEKEPSVHVEYT